MPEKINVASVGRKSFLAGRQAARDGIACDNQPGSALASWVVCKQTTIAPLFNPLVF